MRSRTDVKRRFQLRPLRRARSSVDHNPVSASTPPKCARVQNRRHRYRSAGCRARCADSQAQVRHATASKRCGYRARALPACAYFAQRAQPCTRAEKPVPMPTARHSSAGETAAAHLPGPATCRTLRGAPGLAHGSAWLTEICPPLAKLVSRPAPDLPLDHRHIMPSLAQEPGTRHTDHAGAQYEHAQCQLPSNAVSVRSRIPSGRA